MISRTFNADLIKSVMTRPDMWATVAEDGFEAADWEPDVQECWLEARDDDGLIGLFNLHVLDNDTLQAHPMILTERRGLAAYQAGKLALKWVVNNSAYKTIICKIPVIYRNVKAYALKLGFVKTDIIRREYTKGGKIHDMWNLAITRADIEATL